MEVFDRYRTAPLQTLLNQLIAAQDGVRPEEVTPEYIHNQREKRFYPSTRYDIDSRYGGYDSRRLKFLSRDEFAKVTERVNERLRRIIGVSQSR